jgi:DNA excision repair protein ERCC-4
MVDMPDSEENVIDLTSDDIDNEFDTHFGLLTPSQTVIVRAYSDDSDDQVLAEIRPTFIVMFEPNEDFIRRIEVCY